MHAEPLQYDVWGGPTIPMLLLESYQTHPVSSAQGQRHDV